jgi:hypothetical protein
VSYHLLQLEETPRYEAAPTAAPYRISTNKLFMPIQSARIAPSPTHLDRADELRNIEGVVPRALDVFEPVGSISVRAYLNSLVYLLELAGFVGTPTAGNGIITDPDGATIPTGVTRWVFNKRTYAANAQAKTAQIIEARAESSQFYKGQGYGVTSLTMNAAGEVTADLEGLVFLNIADPAESPTIDVSSIMPMRRADLQIQTWLAGTGETDDFSFQITNPIARRKSFGLAQRTYYPDKMFPGDERVQVAGSIPKYTLDNDDVNALLAATTFTAKARWQSDVLIGATAKPYSMWLEMGKAMYVAGQPDELGNRRRYGFNPDFIAAWDEGAGYDARITLLNAVTAINTFA